MRIFLRRVSVVLLIVFAFGFSFAPSASAGSFASAIRTAPARTGILSASAPRIRGRPNVIPLEPPHGCALANDGEIWNDPSTGDVWKCNCFVDIQPKGPNYQCVWELLDDAPNPSTWINFNSGLYMDVEGPSTSNGARIHLWTYTGGWNQWWWMSVSGYGGANLNAVSSYSGKCLGVNGGSTSPGAAIVQWGCNGNPDQAWVWAWTGSYTFAGWPIWNVVDYKSGMCLGISNGSIRVGAYAVQWPCNGSPDQEWY